MEQRFTFDRIAFAYRASRPEYPEALVDDVVSYADLKPGDPVLEIGCSTGQATKSFATRGLQIVAIDPGSELVRVRAWHILVMSNWSRRRSPLRLIVRYLLKVEAINPRYCLAGVLQDGNGWHQG